MKGAVFAFLGCLGVLVLAVAALVALTLLGGRRVAERPRPVPSPTARPLPTPEPTPDPDVFLSRVARLNGFERADEGRAYRLSYRFIDYGGRMRTVTCRVDQAGLRRAIEGYGLSPARWDEVNRHLRATLEAEVRRRGLERYFTVETHGRGAWRWSWRVPGDTEPPEYERAVREARALAAYMEKEFDDDAVESQVMRPWGVRVRRNTVEIDYAAVVEGASVSVDDCARALAEQARGGTLRQALGIMVAFFQELRYQVPPEEPGRETMGLWVPPDVLVRAAGDCDSKSIALCASWRRLPSRSIVVIVPEHALVGIEAKPAPGERFVRLGNRYFVLAEVAGPAKRPPGVTDIKGDFEYVMFEPLPGAALP